MTTAQEIDAVVTELQDIAAKEFEARGRLVALARKLQEENDTMDGEIRQMGEYCE